jgi:hypothetical protein
MCVYAPEGLSVLSILRAVFSLSPMGDRNASGSLGLTRYYWSMHFMSYILYSPKPLVLLWASSQRWIRFAESDCTTVRSTLHSNQARAKTENHVGRRDRNNSPQGDAARWQHSAATLLHSSQLQHYEERLSVFEWLAQFDNASDQLCIISSS